MGFNFCPFKFENMQDSRVLKGSISVRRMTTPLQGDRNETFITDAD